MRPRHTTSGIAAILVLATLTACGDHGRTDELVTAGKSASNHLASYYDRLRMTTMDWWAYQTTYNTLQDITTTQELDHATTDRLAALRARATIAARLADVYDTISQLRNPKNTQPTVTAAQDLGKALSSVPKLPGGPDLASGIGQAADFLMGLKRDRDFATTNKAITDAVTRVRDLFSKEHDTYEAFMHDHNKTRQALLQSLARKNIVNTNPLLERLRLGVTWTSTDPAATRDLALNIDTITSQRAEAAWNCATDETLTTLNLLVAAHEQLINSAIPAPAPLERATARATACLTEGAQQ
jgi:hypothetical protein